MKSILKRIKKAQTNVRKRLVNFMYGKKQQPQLTDLANADAVVKAANAAANNTTENAVRKQTPDIASNIENFIADTKKSKPRAAVIIEDPNPEKEFITNLRINSFMTEDLYDDNGQCILTSQQLQNIYAAALKYIEAKNDKFSSLQEPDNDFIINIFTKILTFDVSDDKDAHANKQQFLEKIQDDFLDDKYGIRINKHNEFASPRTINIIKVDGKYKLIALTNQKTSEVDENTLLDQKELLKNNFAFLGKGSFKSVKLCWDLTDGKPKPMARLQIEVDTTEELEKVLKEVYLSRRYDSNFVDQPHIGSIYTHVKNGKISYGMYLYSEPALCSLEHIYKYLTPEELKKINAEKQAGLVPTIFSKLLGDALKGLDSMHQAGDVHRDVKPENIFVYRDSEGNLSAKIADVGNATMIPEYDPPGGTYHCASPQVFRNFPDAEYYFPAEDDPSIDLYSFGKVMYEDMQNNFPVEELYTADSKDDIYAIGVCMYSLLAYPNDIQFTNNYADAKNIFMNQFKSVCNRYPIITELMHPTRAGRPTATVALEKLDATTNSGPAICSN